MNIQQKENEKTSPSPKSNCQYTSLSTACVVFLFYCIYIYFLWLCFISSIEVKMRKDAACSMLWICIFWLVYLESKCPHSPSPARRAALFLCCYSLSRMNHRGPGSRLVTVSRLGPRLATPGPGRRVHRVIKTALLLLAAASEVWVLTVELQHSVAGWTGPGQHVSHIRNNIV